ncbi:ribonuclease P protein component 1 [Thermogladius calderae]|uniref:ribonuclease P protein component 1 n=1 Tax=Thermogladius calderae TaxID=1200300 RepID=UPI001EE66DAD|nr:ribonuclease P protein subunit [Thermogladius calderae]
MKVVQQLRINSKNILFHEIIGLRVRVLSYTDTNLNGLEGVVIDETLKTLLIETAEGRRIRVFKPSGVFEFKLPHGEVVVIKGDLILGRPAERLKRLKRRLK